MKPGKGHNSLLKYLGKKPNLLLLTVMIFYIHMPYIN